MVPPSVYCVFFLAFFTLVRCRSLCSSYTYIRFFVIFTFIVSLYRSTHLYLSSIFVRFLIICLVEIKIMLVIHLIPWLPIHNLKKLIFAYNKKKFIIPGLFKFYETILVSLSLTHFFSVFFFFRLWLVFSSVFSFSVFGSYFVTQTCYIKFSIKKKFNNFPC